MSYRKFIIKNSNNREFFINIEIIRNDNTTFFYIIFNDKQHMKKWYAITNLNENTTFDVNDIDYFNNEINLRYLKHFHKNAFSKNMWRLLILNDYKFYINVEFVIKCQKLKIISFQFYLYITHMCQFLNVVYFQSLKHYYKQIINEIVRFNEKIIYIKIDFLITYQNVKNQVFTINNVKSIFKKIDLFFYFFDIVFDKIRIVKILIWLQS